MSKKINKILLALMIMVAIGLSIATVYSFYSNYKAELDSDAQREIKPTVESNEEDKPELMDFDELKKMNSDIIGWITMNGTTIDYPVVQGSNNEYYLNRTAEKKRNVMGAIFLDYRTPADFSEFSSIIYGHYFKAGKMFGALQNYKEQSFFEQNTTGVLYTPEATYILEIVSVAKTDSYSDFYKLAFVSPAEKDEHLAMIKEKSLYYRDSVELTYDDHLLVLSTCSREFKGARTVVVAKMTAAS